MKTGLLTLSTSLLLTTFIMPAYATIYICPVNGQAVFSSVKISPLCEESKMDGISGTTAAVTAAPTAAPTAAVTAPEAYNSQDSDGITKIWDASAHGAYDDVKILPTTPESESDAQMNIKLRNETNKPSKYKKPTYTAPVFEPKSRPKLTRKQILQNEIKTEQSALAHAKSRLEAAKKSGKGTAIAQHQRAVNDREANIRAIKSEMR